MNFLWPRISLPVLGRIFVIALLGTVIAGTYGVLHDQLTLTISPEYFTKFKIHQFHYLGDESGSRIRVAKISFLATWWVGFFAGWFMGRILVPRLGFRSACSFSLRDFLSFSWARFCGRTTGHFRQLGLSRRLGVNQVSLRRIGCLGCLGVRSSGVDSQCGIFGSSPWINRGVTLDPQKIRIVFANSVKESIFLVHSTRCCSKVPTKSTKTTLS